MFLWGNNEGEKDVANNSNFNRSHEQLSSIHHFGTVCSALAALRLDEII